MTTYSIVNDPLDGDQYPQTRHFELLRPHYSPARWGKGELVLWRVGETKGGELAGAWMFMSLEPRDLEEDRAEAFRLREWRDDVSEPAVFLMKLSFVVS